MRVIKLKVLYENDSVPGVILWSTLGIGSADYNVFHRPKVAEIISALLLR